MAGHPQYHGVADQQQGSARISSGLDTSKPAAAYPGRLYFATDTLILYQDNGVSWIEILRGESVLRLASINEKSHVSLTDKGTNTHSTIDIHLGAVAPHSGHLQVGGQIGGSASSPDVRGIRETSGPTLLTIGVVADGQYLKRSGSNVVGDTPPGASDIAMSNLAPIGDRTIPAGHCAIVVGEYEIVSGYELEIGSDAELEIS